MCILQCLGYCPKSYVRVLTQSNTLTIAREKAAKALKEKGETPEELLQSIKENEAAVAEAQRVVDAWKAIVGEKSRREEAAKAEAERIATEKAEAERKAAEERERAEKEEEARVEAERKAEEAESDKEEAEKRMDDEEPKPLGSGVFGNIYNQFKGKVKEAFDFLMKHKGGDLLGVFHRKDVGDIDLVWGDENGGLAHILNKHVGEGKSFANVDEAMSHIQNIIETGKNDFEDGDKIVFRKGSELVTVRKNFREGGKKIADKNWVLTAYDKEAADNGNRVTTKVIEGKATPHTASIDKGSEKPEKKQEKQSVFDKAKEIADKEEKKRKAEAEDDSALGQATRAVGKKKKVNLFKYTASEKNSYPTLRGVHYANGYAYASDGSILFKEKADYPKEWEGTIRDKNGNLIDGIYPDTEKAIHRLVHILDKEVESLPSKEVLDFAIAASKKLKGEAIPVAIDGIFFNAVNLKKFLEAVASKGMDKVVYRHPMLYATNGKDEIVMMPTVNTLEGTLDIADKMERAGLPKEQIDAWKAHIEAADKKMSFEDFQNAEKNAKRKGVRLTEAESPKRKADERYQRGEGGVKPSKAEVALRDAVIDRLRESGMDVIADEAEGQRVLDEVNGRAKVQMGDAPETFAERQKQAVESHGVVMPGLNESYVEVVKDIPRHEYTGSIAEATREAIDAAKRKYAGKELTYNNYGANFNYTISANAIDICLSPKHQNLSANKGIHLALAEHLDEVINKSVEVEEHPDYIKGKDGKRGEEVNPNAIMHRFYGVAVIDGTPCRVMTLMREDGRSEEANGVHSYEVQKIEVLDNESPSTSNGVGTQMKDLSAYPLAKLLKGVEKSYDKGKYLLDESKKRSVGLREQRVDGADGVRFFRTANGEAYGFTVGGRIYIDPRIATSETPVHEYAHLWAEALRNGNPKEWQNVVELMKGTKVWDEVKARYPELKSDDEIADEVIATYSGRRGAERLREEQRKIAEGNGGVFEKAEAVNALERVKQALKKFWNGVADFLHIHYKSAEEVADRVMKDLLEGVDPRKMGKTKDGGVRFSAKQKRALETASLGNVPRSLTVVSSAAGANVLNNIENLAKEFEKSATQPKTFIGDVAKALGASRFGSGSEYATFETKNGNIVTIRLANHNAHVSGFDHNDKDNGISIVISPKPNEGITNDGNAHITEFYYDSIKLRRAEGKPLAEIVRSIKQALYSGEFKDTTGLAERQEVNGEDVIRYQSSSENSDKTLAGVHNITEEKLRKALKLGGLANPSVAVIDISKNSHEGFGEISLILPSEKVAKRTGKNAGTWQGDAWTPTYPQIERRMSNKGAEKASKDVLSVPSDMYSEVRIGLDRWLDSGEANSAMAYMFLHEKGVAPEPKKIQPKFSDEAYNELKSITAGNFNIYGISKADAQKVLAMYIDAYFDGDKDLYEDKTKAWLEKNRSIVDAGDKGGMRYAIAKENVKLYDEYGFNYRGVQTFVRDVEYDHRNTGVDMNATLNEVEDYIKTNSLTDEFNTWQEGKEKEYGIKEVIFDGFTPSGNRRYIPNTLENVSKIMKKQGRNGATGAWASFPNFAARLMPSYGTLEDIRSKKGLLTSDREKIDDFREKWSKVFFELGMKCQPDATGTFDDYGFDRLSEAAMTSDPQAFLKQEYNVDFSDEDTKRLKKMVKAIKEEYPAMYFETKFERPVYLNEFAAVVVPNDLGADVKKALSDLGIAMYEYDASKEGDRSRAFDEAVKSSGKIRFQFIGEKGAAEADHAEEVFANENVERSVRESRSEKTDLTAEERELRDNLVERMRKGGLDVVTDSEEMQRVIDTENERTRNMFVGEKGATEADKAEEVSTRLDNLSVARRMEKAKKDAKTIKMATGWERGSDGKWRYETSDIKPKPFEEWMNKKNLKLGDIIDPDSGLFEMYPELKDFKVTRGKGKSTNAAIYTGLGKIEINFSKFKPYMSIPSNREKINGILHRVINHEIQHAIQDSEGFAQGVSPNAFSPDAPIGKLREMEEADGRMVERYNAMSYTEKALGEGVRLKERILENRKEYNALASKYRFGMDGYTRAAGEVEARNTEKRIGMTEEERRASLASETEDVAREDQILLGVDNADGEVNTGSVREHRVYHGSGADFDAFDHSHMGEGEGAQAYGWGTYVTEVEGIGRTYAIQNTTKHNDALRALQHDVDAISDQLDRHRDDLKYNEEQLKRANEWRAEAELDYELFRDEAEELKEKYGESSPEYRNHLFNDIYTDEMKRAQSSVKSTEESIQYRKEKIAELEKALKDKQAEIDELPKEFPRHLYTVEIPDDNGSNYLDWNGHPAESLLKDVGSFLESEGFERVQDNPARYEKGESTVVLNPKATGADLYAELQKALGSDKKASQALAELGCIGIKYPADNMRGGREDGAKNYVIFNENDAKITDHTRFLRTASGEVYGLVKDGRIYLDPKVATAETAVHEYTHLWGDMLRRKDSEQWSHTVKELKDSVLWEEVKELYPELKTDDEIADEVLSTFSGRRGAERLREEARRVADGDGGVFTKAKAIETLERVKEAIARFWEGVARMFGINRYRSAEELADMAMKDLLDSKNPMKDESGMRKRGEVGETLATSGTYFSGGGLLEAGLKGVIDPKVAVEFSEKIAGVYADNHGNHIVVADVRDVDPKKLVGAVDGGEVQYFHASPVCKNFSKAKREGGEVELDKETALSTAEFIAKTRPKVVTIENVKGYRNSEALKIITDELTRQGYDWDADVYNAADYGGYTKRERLIVRAKRDGKLPPKPEKLPEELRKKGWYSAVEDLIPHLEEKKTGVPQGTDERLKNSGIDYRTIDKPLYVFGRGYANKTVGHAFADELLPTLTTGGGDIIIMPDGRVLKASPRVLARVTGLPDTYKMPETDQLSHTIVGNGIPTQLTEGVIAPLLDNAIPSAERATKRESVFDVADRVSQNLEERTRAMGSRVEKRMADVAQKLEGREFTAEQKAVVDVFSGKSDNQKFSVEREDGKKVSVVVRKGTETSAGTKHSLYRHYNTNVGTITTDDILLIPQIIKEGEIKRIRKGNEQYVEYTQKIGDKKLTTLMQIVNGKEVFNNFYSNKKGSELPASRNAESIDNTPEGAHNINSEPSAKVEDKSESPKLFGEEIIDDGKKGSDSIDRSVRENPKNEDKPRFSRKPGESIFDYASRVSEDVDRSVREIVSARDEYEKKVKSKGFQTKEALQNSMLGLQEFMSAIDHASGNKRYIEDIPDFENPILGENRLSSVNKEEMHQVAKTQFKPLMSAVAKLSGNGKESGELYDYMFAKHGLERDAVMRQREAQKEFDKYQKANPKGTKTIGDFVASLEGKDYAGLTALTAEDGRVKSIQSQIDAIDEQMEATDNQLLLHYLGGQKKRLKVDLLNAARDAADDIRKAFESDPNHNLSDINELWSRVNEVNGNTLRKLYESGMLTKEAYNDISSMYTNYIPMRGFDQTTSADAYAYLTHGDSAFNAPIKTAKGRSSKADNPIAYMQAMAESAIMQGNRNVLVKQKMLNFVRNHPSDLASVSDVWLQYDSVADEWKPVFPDNIDANDSASVVAKKMEAFEDKMKQMAEKHPDLVQRSNEAPDIPYKVVEKGQLNEHQVLVKQNGKSYIITVNGSPRAAQAANGLTNPDTDLTGAVGKVLEGAEALNRQLSSLYTTLNPDFIGSNYVRDALYSNTMVYVKEGAKYGGSFNLNFAKYNPAEMANLYARYNKGSLDTSNETHKLFLEFMQNGGETGFVNLKQIEKRKSEIAKAIKRDGEISAAQIWGGLNDAIDFANRAVENSARFAAYVTSRKSGRSVGRSVYDAKEISVNFNRKGSGRELVERQRRNFSFL